MALEDLIRYEKAAIAVQKEKEHPDIAIASMERFYEHILTEKDDPLIQTALNEARQGLEVAIRSGTEPSITSLGLKRSMAVYSNKFEKAYQTAKISDLVNYVSDSCDIPEDIRKEILEYGDSTLEGLVKKSKENSVSDEDKKKISRVVQTLLMMKNEKLENVYMGIRKYEFEKTLKALYSNENNSTS